MDFLRFPLSTTFTSINTINQLIFLMVKCGVLFQVRTEFLNVIKMSIGFNANDIKISVRSSTA
jgi:hypothetical protein